MKILITGDLHFNKKQFKWIESQSYNYDIICITGDFLDKKLGTIDDITRQIKWVSEWLTKFNSNLFICSGNHDADDYYDYLWLSNIRNKMICTDNGTKVIKGIKFGCIPYIGSDIVDFADCDVIVSHIPPKNTLTSKCKNKKQDFGDNDFFSALKKRVITPKYFLCGHVETPCNTQDTVSQCQIINPGTNRKADVPNHAIIDYCIDSFIVNRS